MKRYFQFSLIIISILYIAACKEKHKERYVELNSYFEVATNEEVVVRHQSGNPIGKFRLKDDIDDKRGAQELCGFPVGFGIDAVANQLSAKLKSKASGNSKK